MNWIFNNDRPIYIQLVEQIKVNIISGIYKQGERLPSVRDLAIETKVNPNTMQKALIELEQCGLIYTQRTNGRFVTENIDLIEKIKYDMAKNCTNDYLGSMQKMGFSKTDTIKYIKKEGEDE